VQRSLTSRHYDVMTPETRSRTLYDAHYGSVARYLLSRGHQTADTDDLIAATFEVAWRRLDAVPADREAVPWLLTVARNFSHNAQRKSQRELALLTGMARDAPPVRDQDIEDRSELRRVLHALTQLKALDRELILLVAWHELTPAEAGTVLGLRGPTARSRLHRARQRLSALLAAEQPSTGSQNLGNHISFITPIIEMGEAHDV
jgi:RNA polymerase sigma-70 factor, ECF subfamily